MTPEKLPHLLKMNTTVKVALAHASLNTKPVREVHGGCTPEEILVPLIVISNKKLAARTFERSTETKQQSENVASEAQKKKGFEEEELF